MEEQKEKHALLIAIEKYNDPLIKDVTYAENDATEFANALKGIGYPKENIEKILTENATKATIKSNFRRFLGKLNSDDELLFFYAGHGFYGPPGNYISCKDTVIKDPQETAVQLEYLFRKIQESRVTKASLFLDACHSGLTLDEDIREMLTEEMSDEEFRNFLRESEHQMVFSSCKLNQKSHSSPELEHGIWSYHLIRAFKGEAQEALQEDRYLTATSLQNYLSKKVPETLRTTKTGTVAQTPQQWGNMTHDFMLADLEEIIVEKRQESETLQPHFEGASLIGTKYDYIENLEGFRKHSHHVPDNRNQSTKNFVHKIGEKNLQNVYEKIYDDLKENFDYLRDQLKVAKTKNAASINTPEYTLHITLDQSSEEPEKYKLETEITDIRESGILSEETFQSIFDGYFDRIKFRFSEKIEIVEIIDQFESLKVSEPSNSISVSYPPEENQCTIQLEEVEGEIIYKHRSLSLVLNEGVEISTLLEQTEALASVYKELGVPEYLPFKHNKGALQD